MTYTEQFDNRGNPLPIELLFDNVLNHEKKEWERTAMLVNVVDLLASERVKTSNRTFKEEREGLQKELMDKYCTSHIWDL